MEAPLPRLPASRITAS